MGVVGVVKVMEIDVGCVRHSRNAPFCKAFARYVALTHPPMQISSFLHSAFLSPVTYHLDFAIAQLQP